MRQRVVALLSGPQEMYPVTCAAAVFGCHGMDIPQHYDFTVCAERPGPMATTMGVSVQVTSGLEALKDAGTVLIPGWCGRDFSEPVLEAVGAAHARGARIVAVSGGVYIPAALGLLDGRRSSVHWEQIDDLVVRFPRIRPDATVLYVDHGDVATAGTSAPTIDLCLNQVRHEHGAALALRIGRQFGASPHREGRQRQYPELPTTGPVPDSLAPLLEWIASHLDHPLTVDDMAARLGVSSRTLSRHFTEQLGIAPGQWLLDQRIARTRALLEETDLPVETIAKRVGLSSAVNLRRRFHNALTTTPAAYRNSFR